MQTATVPITRPRLWFETMPTCLLHHSILMLQVLKLLVGYRGTIVFITFSRLLLFSSKYTLFSELYHVIIQHLLLAFCVLLYSIC